MTPLCKTRAWMLSIVLAAGAGSAPLFADLPSPQLDIITPVGAAAGGSCEATLQGADLDGVKTLRFGHPSITAEFVKDNTFKISVAADVPSGTYDVRAIGRFGNTNPRLFAVQRGLTDVAEVEPNNLAAEVQPVSLNSAISGASDGNGQDLFRVPLKAGQRVIFDLQSARLETEMDGNLFLFSSDGSQVAASADHVGRDPVIDFVVPADGDYVVEVRDLVYRGGYPYRLLIHDRPHVEAVFPRAVHVGTGTELVITGQNLPGGAASTWTLADKPLVDARMNVTLPPELISQAEYRFREHPLFHSPIPTAATATLIGEQLLPFEANAVSMLASEVPTQTEAEPNGKDMPQVITLPAVVNGRFDQPRDADWYEFETTDEGQYQFDVYSERIDGRADPYLALHDMQGNRFAELDDFGHRVAAFDGHLRDPSGPVNLAAKTRYRVLVQDRYQRGGVRYQYVLTIRKQSQDFFAAGMQGMNQNLNGFNLWSGGSVLVDTCLHSRGPGYFVTVTAEGLPPGVHCVATSTETGNNHLPVVLTSDPGTPAWTGPIQLIATAKLPDGSTLRRQVRPYVRSNPNGGNSRVMSEFILTVTEPAPFRVELPERITVEANKPVEVPVTVSRLWPQFTDSVNLASYLMPGGFSWNNLQAIPSGQTTGTVQLVVPNVKPGEYTVTLLGQAQVPFNKDPDAKDRPQAFVSMPARSLTVTVTAPPQK